MGSGIFPVSRAFVRCSTVTVGSLRDTIRLPLLPVSVAGVMDLEAAAAIVSSSSSIFDKASSAAAKLSVGDLAAALFAGASFLACADASGTPLLEDNGLQANSCMSRRPRTRLQCWLPSPGSCRKIPERCRRCIAPNAREVGSRTL
eukprot:scaffold2752_cov393-Prasinococcus_capsulatus_cf.AAC.27